MRLLTLTIASLALMAPIATASAAAAVRAGILQCQGGQNVGFVVGSVTNLECVFRSEGRRPEPYIAKVQRIGLDLGVTEQTQLSWAVNAPNTRLGRGELAGSYGGVGANASIGIGGGGNFLVGPPVRDQRHPHSPPRPRRQADRLAERAAAHLTESEER